MKDREQKLSQSFMSTVKKKKKKPTVDKFKRGWNGPQFQRANTSSKTRAVKYPLDQD